MRKWLVVDMHSDTSKIRRQIKVIDVKDYFTGRHSDSKYCTAHISTGIESAGRV